MSYSYYCPTFAIIYMTGWITSFVRMNLFIFSRNDLWIYIIRSKTLVFIYRSLIPHTIIISA